MPYSSSSGFSIARYLNFLRRRWWVVILTVGLCVGLALAYIFYWPLNYSSSAYLWVTGKIGVRMQDGPTYSDDAQSFYGTQVELLQSPQVMMRAVSRLRDQSGLQVASGPNGQPNLPKLRVSQLPKSAVFELKAKGADTNYVQVFLNAVIDEFLTYRREIRSGLSGDALASLSSQVTKYESELKSEQDKLNSFQRTNNIAVLEEQAKTAGVFLTQLHSDYSRLKLELDILEATAADKRLSESLSTNAFPHSVDPRKFGDATLASTSQPSVDFVNARQQLEVLKIQKAQLEQYLRPKHPDMIQLDEEIARAEKLFAFFRQQSRDQLANATETVRLRLPRVQEAITNWESKVSNASQQLAELDRMKMNLTRVQSLYDRLLGMLQSVDVARSIDQENFAVLQKASDPLPANLSPPIAIGLSLFFGLGLGLTLVFLMERLDDRLTSLDEVSNRFSEWVVGQVPEVKNERKKRRPALLDGKDQRHIFAESYRSIRSALIFGVPLEMKPKTLLVTSAVPNEGKSTVAANLARTMAFSGTRVLLIDADLRRGIIHELFGLPANPGLAELLSKYGNLGAENGTVARDSDQSGGHSSAPVSLNQYIIPTAVPKLFLLPCGNVLHNSGELLLGRVMDELLAQVREAYDCVVMDSMPVFAADDTTSLAPKMDGVIFVIRNSFSSARTTQRALEMLYDRQAKILGLVYNRANSDSRSYYYYKYAAYERAAKSA